MPKVIKSTEPHASECSKYERDTLAAPEPLDLMGCATPEEAAAQILADARAEAEAKVQEAYAEGFARGQEAGHAAFIESVGQAAQVLEQAGAAMAEARERFLGSLETELLELTKAAAERVLRREVRTDPELIRTTIRAALESLLDREHFTVYVNPKDLEVLREHDADLLGRFDAALGIEVVEDEDIEPGGCRVESEEVHVDARTDVQLQRVLDAMTE